MSRKKIKIGRYTKVRIKENENSLRSLNSLKESVPFLPKNSSSHDLIVRCINILSCNTVNLADEIENFEELFNRLSKSFSQGFYPRNDYENVISVTGVEIDNRKYFFDFIDVTYKSALKKFIRILQKFPGFENLSEKDFYLILHRRLDYIRFIISLVGYVSISNNELIFHLDESHILKMRINELENLSDKKLITGARHFFEALEKVKVTFEEIVFLFSLGILSPDKDIPEFVFFQNKFLVCFQEYLENMYGKTYHERMLKLVNMVALFKESYHNGHKWILNNKGYIKKVSCEFANRYWMIKDPDEIVSNFKKLMKKNN